MAGPSLKLGSAEFDEETPVAVREKPSARERMKKAAASGREFYTAKIAPRKRAILYVLGAASVITGASLIGSSFYESHQERKAQVARETEEEQTPKASLKLSVKAKHDGYGKLTHFSLYESSPDIDVDACPNGTHELTSHVKSIEDMGQGIYKVTVVLNTEAHGRDLQYRFSFEVDEKDYDYMPVEAILVQ